MRGPGLFLEGTPNSSSKGGTHTHVDVVRRTRSMQVTQKRCRQSFTTRVSFSTPATQHARGGVSHNSSNDTPLKGKNTALALHSPRQIGHRVSSRMAS
jgi:hypothetical protein